MKVYLAHPTTEYGGDRQAAAIALIEASGHTVENPDQIHHEKGYWDYGMPYFEGVVKNCEGLAFMRFRGGEIGAGVAKEIQTAFDNHMPVWELRDGIMDPIHQMPEGVLSVDDTKTLIRLIKANS